MLLARGRRGGICEALHHGRAKTIPAREGQAALAPAETPGNGAQVFNFLRSLAGRRPRADVELGDFTNRRRAEEILGEPRSFIHQRAVGRHAGFRQARCRLQKRAGGGLGRLQQRCFKRRRHQGFKVATADFRVGVFGADHFALLGQANLSAHRARRLRQNGLVARATATADRAAPAMEHPELDVVYDARAHAWHNAHCAAPRGGWPALGWPGGAAGHLVKQFNQSDFSAVQLPVAGKDAAVLITVGVTQHDVLLGAAALHQLCDAGQGVVVAHDRSRVAQVFDRFK